MSVDGGGLGQTQSHSMFSLKTAIARTALFAVRARLPHPVDVAVRTRSVAGDATAKELRVGVIVRRRVLLVCAVVSAARETRCRAPVHIEFQFEILNLSIQIRD